MAVSRLLAPIPKCGLRRVDARRAVLSESGAKEVADRGARGSRRVPYARRDDDSRRILAAAFRFFLDRRRSFRRVDDRAGDRRRRGYLVLL